jgi:hypothetical protein
MDKEIKTYKTIFHSLFMLESIGPFEEESDPEINSNIAKYLDKNTGAIAFIAPYVGARLTPSKTVRANINIPEEFGMEDAINTMKRKGIKKIYLLINSFGGTVTSSYKIARMLRKSFSDITVFIPNISASGGTLIALTGNRIIMGDMSNISPLDVQLQRQGNMVSVNAMLRSFSALTDFFKDKHESDVPYPWVAMANKLDPVEYQEWVDISDCMEKHAMEILSHSKSNLKQKAEDIVKWLSVECPSHSYSITFQEAKDKLGKDYILHCTNPKYSHLWEPMRKWFGKYMVQSSGFHIIRYIVNNKRRVEKNEKRARVTKKDKKDILKP